MKRNLGKQPPEDGQKSKRLSEIPKTTEIKKRRLVGDEFEDEKKNMITENNKSKADITCGTSISKKSYTFKVMKTAEEDIYVINTLNKFGFDERLLQSFAVTNWCMVNRLSTAIYCANSVGLDEQLLFKLYFKEKDNSQRKNVAKITDLFFLFDNLSNYIERCYSHVRGELEKKCYVRLNRLPDKVIFEKVCDAAKMQPCLGQKKSVMQLSASFPSNDYVSKSNCKSDENTTESINFEKRKREDFKKICESDILLKKEKGQNSFFPKNDDEFLGESGVEREKRKHGTIIFTAEEIDHPYGDVEKTTDKKSFDIESSSNSKFSNETNPRNADMCSCQSNISDSKSIKNYRSDITLISHESDITCGTSMSKKNFTFKVMKTAEEDMHVINTLQKFGFDERRLQSFAVANWCIVNRLSKAIDCANSIGLDEHILCKLYFKEKENSQRNNVAKETDFFFLFDNLSDYIERCNSHVRSELEKKCHVRSNRLPDKVIFEKVCDAANMQPCLGQKKSVMQLPDSFPSNDYVSKSNCKSELDENTTESINFEKRKRKDFKEICESDILPKKENEKNSLLPNENAVGEVSKDLVVILDESEMSKSENALEKADGHVFEENENITKSALNVVSADKIIGIILSPDEDTAKDSTASKIKKFTFKEMEETNEKLQASKSQDIIGEEDHTITVISEVERNAHAAIEVFPSNDYVSKSNCKSDSLENTTEDKNFKKICESDILLKKENETNSFFPKNDAEILDESDVEKEKRKYGAVLSTAEEIDHPCGDDVEKTTDKNSLDIESSSNSKFPNETNPRNAKCPCQSNISHDKSIKKYRCKKHFLEYTKIVSHGNRQLSKIPYIPRGTSHFNDTSLDLINTAQPFCRQNCMCDQAHENTDEKATENYKDEKVENAGGESSKKLVVILDKITAKDSTISKIKKLTFKEMEETNVKRETSKSQDIIVEEDHTMRKIYEIERNAHAAMNDSTEFALFGTEDNIVVPRPSSPWLHAPWLYEPTAENTSTDSFLAFEQNDLYSGDFASQFIYENNEVTVHDIGSESTVDPEIDLTSLYPDIIFSERNDNSDRRENDLRFLDW